MAKKERRGAIVERVRNARTKREGAVRLDKGAMMFFARDPDEDATPENKHIRGYFESRDGTEVRRWLEERFKKSDVAREKPLDWKPVIEVEIEEDRWGYRRRGDKSEERQTQVKAEVDRYYLALSNDKTEWFKLGWHQCDPLSSTCLPEEDRLIAASQFGVGPKAAGAHNALTIPSVSGRKSRVWYTEELWLGLNQVFDNLDHTRATIQDMLGTKKGLAMLAEVGAGAKRLAAGQMTAEEVPNGSG